MTVAEIRKSPIYSGLYGIPESARYLANTPPLINGNRVETAKLRYWIKTSVPPIQEVEFPSRQRLISFLDLISMRMIAILRSRKIALEEIRNTEIWLRKDLGIPSPLASKGLWTYGHHIYIKFEEHILAASKFGQQAMDFVRSWLSEVEIDMTFDSNELADTWLIYKDIRLNPKIQFGEPCIDGTRIPISTIWSNYIAGDTVKTISCAHNLNVPQVESVIDWEKRFVAT